MNDCVFCEIVKGNAPASIVYSDEKVLAFMDARPVNLGHLLVIPKAHSTRLSELDEETGGEIFKVAMRLASALMRSGVKCEGVNLLLSDGAAAFQEILHVHLHVIPRFFGDGFRIKFGRSYVSTPGKSELDEVAAKIRRAMR